MGQLIGVFFTVQACVKQMLKQGTGGNIVTIASICSHRAFQKQKLSAYVASKHGVRGLTKQIAAEYADKGIRANSISPGYVLDTLRQ